MDLERGYKHCEDVLRSFLGADSREHQVRMCILLNGDTEDCSEPEEISDAQRLLRRAEINNILTGVCGNLEFMQMESDISADEHGEFFHTLLAISNRAAALSTNPLSAGTHDSIRRSEEEKKKI